MESNELQVFNSSQFGEIRTIQENNKVLFCGADVAKALGYARPNDAITAHCRYTVKRSIPHPQAPDKEIVMSFISEGDVYRLITRSKLPTAEEFERWVFDEVLPTIRKHGAYLTPQKIEEVLCNPDTIIKLCMQLKEEQAKNKELEKENAENKPKVEYFDALVDRGLNTNLRDTAKELKCPPSLFNKWLLENKYIYRDKNGVLKPYQTAMENDYFVLKEYVSGNFAGTQILVTSKGRQTFKMLVDLD